VTQPAKDSSLDSKNQSKTQKQKIAQTQKCGIPNSFHLFHFSARTFWASSNLFGPFQTFSNLSKPQPADKSKPKPRKQLETN
jgi:hypothetical protein